MSELNSERYEQDRNKAATSMLVLAYYLDTHENQDVLRTYQIGLATYEKAVQGDAQEQVDDAAAVMRHTCRVAMFYFERRQPDEPFQEQVADWISDMAETQTTEDQTAFTEVALWSQIGLCEDAERRVG